jgi:hypothetical protein
VIEGWKKINHANIVQLREVFLTKDFDDDQPCNDFSSKKNCSLNSF